MREPNDTQTTDKAPSLIAALLVMLIAMSVAQGDDKLTPAQVAAKIDGFLKKHWETHEVEPAGPASDTAFFRRITLDLAGRLPTRVELDRFLASKSKKKRTDAIDRLLAGPEFPLHMGNVLDRMIQSRYSGNDLFVDYLRRSIRDSQHWDKMFQQMMIGPWDSDPKRASNRFLDKRAKTPDVLAVDTARVFFGVDISCAKCHDHPLVDDWKQKHFYGMVAFFNRTTGGKGKIGEKKEGDVTFVGADGKEQVAHAMFLSGEIAEPPTAGTQKKEKQKKKSSKNEKKAKQKETKKPSISRRKQLVEIALKQREFLSRSIVNRVWDYFFGRGIVDPVDQMHSGNDPAVEGLLEWLAEDFANSGYDLNRLIAAITYSRAYGLSSHWEHSSPVPSDDLFAAARLRPLTQQQLAFAIIQTTKAVAFDKPSDIESRVARYAGVNGLKQIEQYLTIENEAKELVRVFDERRRGFQSSAREALFMSNNQAIQALLVKKETNLAAKLGEIKDNRELLRTAYFAALGRRPDEKELKQLSEWLDQQKSDRQSAIEQLIWSLVTSAEFRFIH